MTQQYRKKLNFKCFPLMNVTTSAEVQKIMIDLDLDTKIDMYEKLYNLYSNSNDLEKRTNFNDLSYLGFNKYYTNC